ncbi:ABC transporter ATP-binding protein [Agrococcus sp. Marseille-P2731]|uniref:ABC transporter ATP-binding protein n=1 Tax=Agrococcus sp. Marseille-P2731 TaxID=1841862 RepID=UPI00092FECEC|nr:ABC transporter ATP-binding protein [Agrococcus sp. Marseille-P2731]
MTVHPADGGSRLEARGASIGYGDRHVIDGLDVAIPDGSFTVIIGPNACGKSTLLRSLARLLPPTHGQIVLDGDDIRSKPTREVARTIGLLPQTAIAPEGITVVDLVSRGRYPHQGLLQQWSAEDEQAVRAALQATSTEDLAKRRVDELSGGQRQRVWIAMVLAQETPLVLLDEPTTFLDIAHQIELLELCRRLHHEGRTLVAVLHDINQAARYATHLIAMRDGAIVAEGTPAEVVTVELVERVFGVRSRVLDDPESHTPMIVPLAHGAVSAMPQAAGD